VRYERCVLQTGLDRLIQDDFRPLRGLRIGLICNPTSVDRRLEHLADLLAARRDVQLVRLFGPEHGIRGAAQYMVAVENQIRDLRTGRPVVSLYGSTLESLTPRDVDLEGLDALVFDIQDVGSRYYTYLWTMALAMSAAGRKGLAFFVLDRPNPVGGAQVEGPLVKAGFESFVGLHPLPVRHGMTAGEVAGWLQGAREIAVDLRVVEMTGWRRAAAFEATGLPWVPPSPNMPTPDTALVYPGQCLLEGTEVSEGRGTTRPFETFGAPFVDPYSLKDRLLADALAGVRFRPLYFTPTFHKFAGESCGGLMLHVEDAETFRPFETGVAIVKAIHDLWPAHFAFREKAYEFVADIPAFDLLCGSDAVRRGIVSGVPLAVLRESWQVEASAFAAERARYLRYA
jgi:uncharacterized protein YbbC (DUF1343 family)